MMRAPARRHPAGTGARRRGARGFTLLELMYVLVVAAIVAALGYPLLRENIREARRSVAEGVLMEMATRQEDFFNDNKTYATSTATLGYADPFDTDGGHYRVSVVAAVTDATTFTIQAVPQGAQVGDECATLAITAAGAKTPAGCW